MGTSDRSSSTRREFLQSLGAVGVGLTAAPTALSAGGRPPSMPARPRRIGIIGSGRQGGSIGLLWAEAGHQILFSSRNPDELGDLVEEAGSNARAGYPDEAADFGEVILIAVPYGALPQVGRDHAHLMYEKTVIDVGNPREDRDGPMAVEAISKGTGIASAEYLPGVRLVRALNTVSFITVREESHRPDPKVGIPVATDDVASAATTESLVIDAGFDPVLVGPLYRAREFDRGTEVYVTGMTADELRGSLDL